MRISPQMPNFGLGKGLKKDAKIEGRLVAVHKNGDAIIEFDKGEVVTVMAKDVPPGCVGDKVEVAVSKVLELMIPSQDALLINGSGSNDISKLFNLLQITF